MEGQVFTLEEAQQLLPQLEEALLMIRRERLTVGRISDDVQKAAKAACSGGGSPHGARYILALERIFESVEEIQNLGVVLKDPDKGLCDFPFRMNGHIVYLCWKLGEPRIEWWHEVNAGYASRQPLDA